MSYEPSLEERKVIYRARRGLKELDIYFDPYVKEIYLHADDAEKQVFAYLVEQEDPDLLDWFMAVSEPEHPKVMQLIAKMKAYYHDNNG